ncbi:hypothetical protein E2C01_100918 [Portunus trituberculatus]|uniref:Uncharacterized protein n=1 Tax=Portunus trituberculatus TaxID=210409 RepID=A0A5B7KET7_PORTR|nr:hypothetical protein [Portunus trituberculatus]
MASLRQSRTPSYQALTQGISTIQLQAMLM